MDTLAGYIATACTSVAGGYLSRFLEPRIKIGYWLSHNFLYTIPANQFPAAQNVAQQALPPGGNAPPQAQNLLLLTHSLTIQNFGRQPAEWIEVVHRRKPDFFQLFPALQYAENISPNGEHALRVESLAPKEFFTIQFLSYASMPELLYIRSQAGHASLTPWRPIRVYPSWIYRLLRALVLAGAGLCAYWLIKAGIFVLKSIGVF